MQRICNKSHDHSNASHAIKIRVTFFKTVSIACFEKTQCECHSKEIALTLNTVVVNYNINIRCSLIKSAILNNDILRYQEKSLDKNVRKLILA